MTLELSILSLSICGAGIIWSLFYIAKFIVIRCNGRVYCGIVGDIYKIDSSEGSVYKTGVSYFDENGKSNYFIDSLAISYRHKIGDKVFVVLRKNPKLEILWSLPRVFGPPFFVLLVSIAVAIHSGAILFLIN